MFVRSGGVFGAGDGNRTHTTSLEGWGSTTELHPQMSLRYSVDNHTTTIWQCQGGFLLFYSFFNSLPLHLRLNFIHEYVILIINVA